MEDPPAPPPPEHDAAAGSPAAAPAAPSPRAASGAVASGGGPPPPSRAEAWTVRALQVVGLAILLRQYVFARGLWHDEAKLANAVLDLDPIEIMGPMAGHSGSPSGFLLATDLLAVLFGPAETVLRGVSFLSGVACVFLVPRVARALLSPWAGAFALAVLVASQKFLYYCNELKPYGSDAAVTLALLAYVALPLLEPAPARRAVLRAAGLGALLAWCSHPAIFTLAGIGATLTWRALRAGDRGRLVRAVAVSAAWVASFAVLFVVRVGAGRDKEYLQEFWDNAFAPLPFTSLEATTWYPKALLFFADSPLGFDIPWGGAIALVAGAVLVIRRGGAAPLLLLLPAAFAVLASMLRSYPLSGRLLVFGAPLAALLVGEAVARIRLRADAATAAIRGVVLAVLLAPQAVSVARQFARPASREEVRDAVLALARSAEAGDEVFVYDGALAMFDFYARVVDLPDLTIRRGYRSREDPTRNFLVLEAFPRDRPLWALFGHVHASTHGSEEEILVRRLLRDRPLLGTVRAPGAALYRFGPAR